MAKKVNGRDIAKNGKKTIRFTTRPNPFPDKAGKKGNDHFGQVIPNGEAGRREIAEMIAADGQMGVHEIERVFNVMAMVVRDEMRRNPRIIDLGFCRLVPVIKGSFRHVDEPFDPKRHELTDVAIPSPDLSKVVQDALRPVNVTPVDVPSPRIDSVCYAPDYARNTISAARPFELHGSGLTVGAGDETAALELPSGAAVPLALELQRKADGTRRVKASLAAPLPSPRPKRAHLVFLTHGMKGAKAPLVEVRSAALKVLA